MAISTVFETISNVSGVLWAVLLVDDENMEQNKHLHNGWVDVSVIHEPSDARSVCLFRSIREFFLMAKNWIKTMKSS